MADQAAIDALAEAIAAYNGERALFQTDERERRVYRIAAENARDVLNYRGYDIVKIGDRDELTEVRRHRPRVREGYIRGSKRRRMLNPEIVYGDGGLHLARRQ